MQTNNFVESSKYLVLGNVDAGKSSFISVMEKNILDDGNGYARSLITKIKHEKTSGRTSTHSFHYILTDNKITTMIDLCGHEKYFKTTMFGVMGLFGDYGILIIGSNMGVSQITREHISLLVVNKIPFIILLTKIDICPENKLIELRSDIKKILNKIKKNSVFFDGSKHNEKMETITKYFQESDTRVVPIIEISCKTGLNVDLTRILITSINSKAYLNNINKQELYVKKSTEISDNTTIDKTVFYVDTVYNVIGIGLVFSGTVKYGEIHMGKKMYLGPINGSYITVTIKSIQNCIRMNVDCLYRDQSGSVGVRLENKNAYERKMFRKGQIICSNRDFAISNTCYSFNCNVLIFNHSTTIKDGYQTVVHPVTVRQNARFIIDKDKILRSNSRENIKIKFVQRPEFILPGTIFMFRDRKTKGIGKIIDTLNYKLEEPDQKLRKKKKSN